MAEALIILVLGGLTLALHKSALAGYWRFDDGALLRVATMFPAWQYFFIPSITRAVSANVNVTPWNVFFYDISLHVFGFEPRGFYVHQLMLLWLSSIATYCLLRLWLVRLWAFVGASLFLLGAPTVHIAQELMTGHYAMGLLCTVVAIAVYVQSVRRGRWLLALLGAFCYLIAITCKEIYVPLALLLPFLPVGTWRRRATYAVPYALLAVAYIPWRYAVLGTQLLIGHGKENSDYALLSIGKAFARIPSLLFGTDYFGWLATGCLAGLVLYGLAAKRLNGGLLAVSVMLILLPMVPLTVAPGISAPDRYLFLGWWAIAVCVSAIPDAGGPRMRRYLSSVPLLILIGVAARGHFAEEQRVLSDARIYEQTYRFVLQSDAHQVFLAPEINSAEYFKVITTGIKEAEENLFPGGPKRARLLEATDDLAHLDASTTLWGYDPSMGLYRDITNARAELIADGEHRRAIGVFVPAQDKRGGSAQLVDGGLCAIDRIAGGNGPKVDIHNGEPWKVFGWAALPEAETPPLRVVLELRNASGTAYLMPLSRVQRPDVAAYFSRPTWKDAGFEATVMNPTQVPQGDYAVAILQRQQDKTWRCTAQTTVSLSAPY